MGVGPAGGSTAPGRGESMNPSTGHSKRRHKAIALLLGSLACLPASANPASVDLEPIADLLKGDVRVLWMSDSYCSIWFTRVPAATLTTWPIERISAIEGGAARYHGILCGLKRCEPLEIIQSSDDLGYRVERSGTTPTYFGLPVRGIQEVCTTSDLVLGSGNEVLEFRMYNDQLATGLHGAFSQPGDQLRMRFLYRATTDPVDQLPSAILQDHDGDTTPIDLAGSSRGFLHLGESPLAGRPPAAGHINAALPDIAANNDLDLRNRVPLSIDPAFVGSNQYLDAAGAIYYQVDTQGHRTPGLYFSYLADDSWSYRGFGDDLPCQDTHHKVFTREQLVHWLDVTTLDLDQPVIFAWYLNPESLGYTASRERIESMIDLADAAAQDVGLPSFQHLIITPHRTTFASGDPAHLMESLQQATFDIATDRPNVSAASIYAATGGVLFDGGDEAEAWLVEHGFDDFEYGTLHDNLVADPISGRLLDDAGIHPASDAAGAFFATVLGDLLREAGCPVDFIPDGRINVDDLLHVITEWGQPFEDDPSGNGTMDINEFLMTISEWGDCWPVQAPYRNRSN